MRLLSGIFAAVFLLMAVSLFPASAQNSGQANGYVGVKRDQDYARDALEEGRILPLSQIRRAVNDSVGGRVIDADLDRSKRVWVYDVRTITDDGQVLNVRVDAQTGRILTVKGQ